MNSRIPVTIPFSAIKEHEARIAESDAQLKQAQALIDNLDDLPELSRILTLKSNPGEQ